MLLGGSTASQETYACTQGRYQTQDRDPYYSVVKDTLLVDVTSLDQRGKYTCFVSFSNAPQSSGSTAIITVEG